MKEKITGIRAFIREGTRTNTIIRNKGRRCPATFHSSALRVHHVLQKMISDPNLYEGS